MHPANHGRKKTVHHHKERIAQYMQRYPNFRLKNNILGMLFVVGLLLFILSTFLFDDTFISAVWLLSIAILIGIGITPLFRRFFNIYFLNPYDPGHMPIFFHFLYHSVAIGSTLIFLFLLSNEKMAHPGSRVATTPVIAYGHERGSADSYCRKPYATVHYDGMEKDVIFDCGEPVESARAVRLELRKGLWGFDVIISQTLVTKE